MNPKTKCQEKNVNGAFNHLDQFYFPFLMAYCEEPRGPLG